MEYLIVAITLFAFMTGWVVGSARRMSRVTLTADRLEIETPNLDKAIPFTAGRETFQMIEYFKRRGDTFEPQPTGEPDAH